MAILWHTPSEKASDMTHYVTGTANDNKVLTPTQLEVDMPKRPNTLNTVMFVIELIRRIPKGRKITASELHQAMLDAGWDRDLRTIQRQLDEISRVFSQYIDRDDREKPYGYSWKPYASGLMLSSMTPQESLLMLLAEQHLRYLLPASVMKSMEGFFKTARTQINTFNQNTRKQKEWLSKVLVISESQPLIPPKINGKVLEAVSNALYEDRWLKLEYKNVAGNQMTADVMPLGLAQQGQRLYLVCRYKGYDNERTLAMHRIKKAEVLPDTFKRPAGFDLKKYDEAGNFGVSYGKRIKLSFNIIKDSVYYLLESPLSTDQTCDEIENGYHLTATVTDSVRLDRWLNGFGDGIWDVKKEVCKIEEEKK